MAMDVSDIIHDPDFVQAFTLIRNTGSFETEGRWTTQEVAYARTGIVLPAKLDDVAFLPEGERLQETIAVYCVEDLQMGQPDAAEPDIIYYQEKFFRIAFVKHYAQVNAYFALAQLFLRTDPPPAIVPEPAP
jgi:hypothetical protein